MADIAVSPLQRQSPFSELKELPTVSKEATGPVTTTDPLKLALSQVEEGAYWVEVSGRLLA